MPETTKKSTAVLSIFPLPVVLFPKAYLPLHIFEERYKSMINHAIENDEPFGIIFFDDLNERMLSTGCSTTITKVKRLPQGRLNILTLGERRFEVRRIIEEVPYIRAEVEYFDDHTIEESTEPLVDDIHQAVKDILHLSSKLVDKEVKLAGEIPITPVELSFWIAANFYGSPRDQQDLLELVDTVDRLDEEFAILDAARKHLAAKVSLKDALG